GGQQQRVGLARALVYQPKVLLLDEPLSNLDAKLREEMRFEIKDVVTRLAITAVYVTHDQEEALALSDRVAIMNRGRLEQLGTPEEIYGAPRSRFVAEFVGLSNFLEGRGGAGGRWPGGGGLVSAGSSVRLADLTKDEFAAAVSAGAWLLLPFGSVEAHGPHLGLGADTIDAAHVCRQVAERAGGLVAPSLPYGVCRTMRNFPGTISLTASTLASVVREVVTEYVRHGARRLALYSGHAEPGQLEALREAVLPVVDAEPRPTVLVVGPYAFLDPVRRAAGLEGQDGHAASLVTSTLLAIEPAAVRVDRIPVVSGRPP